MAASIFEQLFDQLDIQMHNVFNNLPEFFQDRLDFLVVNGVRALGRLATGLKEDVISVNGYDVHFLEGGNPRKGTILFLHGFSDNKYSVSMSAGSLVSDYRIISIDLPGFGDSDKPYKEKYSIEHFSGWVWEFIKRKNLNNIHIMGNSLGGAIAADLASDHPEKFASCVLIDAAGVMGEKPVGVYKMIQEGKNVFAVSNMNEFNQFLHTVFEKMPPLPFLIKHYRYRKFMANRDWYNRLMDDLSNGILTSPVNLDDFDRSLLMNNKIKTIRVPSLILWGEKDQLFPPEIGRLYHELLPGSEFVIMHNTGHVPQIERPGEFASIVRNFMEKRIKKAA